MIKKCDFFFGESADLRVDLINLSSHLVTIGKITYNNRMYSIK